MAIKLSSNKKNAVGLKHGPRIYCFSSCSGKEPIICTLSFISPFAK